MNDLLFELFWLLAPPACVLGAVAFAWWIWRDRVQKTWSAL